MLKVTRVDLQLHLFCMYLSLQAVRYVERHMASKFCSPMMKRKTLSGTDEVKSTWLERKNPLWAPCRDYVWLILGDKVTHQVPQKSVWPLLLVLLGSPYLCLSAPPPPSPSCTKHKTARKLRTRLFIPVLRDSKHSKTF